MLQNEAGSVPERHVAASEAVRQGSPHAHEARARRVPRVGVAGVEDLLSMEVLPASIHTDSMSMDGLFLYLADQHLMQPAKVEPCTSRETLSVHAAGNTCPQRAAARLAAQLMQQSMKY